MKIQNPALLAGAIDNPLILSNGMVGYWSCRDGSGTVLRDFSALGAGRNDGVLTNNPVWYSGISGGSLKFASSAYGTIPNKSSYSVTSAGFTISFWINLQAIPPASTANRMWVISKGNGSAWEWGVSVNDYSQAFGKFNIAVWNQAGNNANARASNLSPSTNVWYFVTFVVANTGVSTPDCYVNGALDNGISYQNISTTAGTSPVYVGTNSNLGEVYLNGFLAGMRLYNRALSASEILTLYRSSPFGPSLQNSSFESPSVGTYAYAPAGNLWNMGGSCGITVGSNTWVQGAVADGTQCAWIQTGGTSTQFAMYQNLSFIPGTIYNIYFMGSQRPTYTGNTFGVFIDGNMIAGPLTPPSVGVWTPYTASFTASAYVHTLMFTASNPLGGDRSCLIDAVRVV